MICYRDTTFCPVEVSAGCAKRASCPRTWTFKHHQAAMEWWGDEHYPVCFFAGRPDCFVSEAQHVPE